MISAFNVLVVIVAAVAYTWLNVQPKINWVPAPVQKYEACPDGKTPFLFVGGTSMLGKYIVESFRPDKKLCLINYGRSKCEKCDINIKGDLRDTRHVHRVLDAYDIETVLTSVKPPLLGIHYRDYIELNLLAMLELIKASKAKGVKNFIYVSSIAAGSHYISHVNSTEDEPKPFLTDYEAPYDVSKRIAEDYVLDAHEEGKFNTIAIRTSGIIGGTGDPYDYLQLPVLVSFQVPVIIDANFAGNIGDALYVVYKELLVSPFKGGTWYYLTGEHNTENELAQMTAKATGRQVVVVPYWVLESVISWWTWARFDHNTYSTLDLLRMAVVSQHFDNTKFFKAFPKYKPKYTMEQALMRLYGN